MKKKLNNNYNLFILIISLVCIGIFVVSKFSNILFILNIILLVMITLKARFSFFSMKAVVVNYMLIGIFFQFTTGHSYGILEKGIIPLHYNTINALIYFYNLVNVLLIYNTNILIKEKEMLEQKIYIGKVSTYFCCFIAVITAIIAFPGIPFAKEYVSHRFNALLPGKAWNHFSIVALIMLLPNLKKSKIVKITYAFVSFWFVSHYERVDIIGVLFFLFIYILNIKKEKKLKFYIVIFLCGILIFFVMFYIGSLRMFNYNQINIFDLIKKVFVNNTAVDVGYVFNSSIEYIQNNSLLAGKTYINYIVKIIPFLQSDKLCANILSTTYNAPGGEFVLVEPLMNFGFVGVIIFTIFEYYIYYLLLSKKSNYRFYIYIFLMATVFRTMWYGWIYIEKALIYLIPFMYIIVQILNIFEKKKFDNKKIENKINVVLYSDRWTTGGIESFTMNLCRFLNKEKINLTILVSQNETNIYDEEITKNGIIKMVILNKIYKSPIIRNIKSFMLFEEKIRECNPDILHLNICNSVGMIYAYLAKKNGVNCVVCHSHSSNIGNRHKKIKIFSHKICQFLFEKYIDEFFTCSDLAAKWMYSKKNNKVKIINNAIDVESFSFNQFKREKIRKKLGLNNELVIGHIGRFCREKNHNFLIDVFYEIYKLDNNAKLLLVGEGELKEEIQKKVEFMGLKDNVIFYGLTQHSDEIFSAIDCFILPSFFEGKPIVAIEAQASSLKVYLSSLITKTVTITNNVEYLDINDNPQKWAEHILENCKNYNRTDVKKMIIDNGYDIEKLCKNLENIYYSLLNKY